MRIFGQIVNLSKSSNVKNIKHSGNRYNIGGII